MANRAVIAPAMMIVIAASGCVSEKESQQRKAILDDRGSSTDWWNKGNALYVQSKYNEFRAMNTHLHTPP